MRLPFRQNIGLTITVIISFIILAGFGSWQLQRLEWKSALIAKVEEGLSGQATLLPKQVELKEDEFKKVKIAGQFLNDKEIHLAAKYYQGKIGYYILTPFKTADGRALLVNRGWVPEAKKDALARPESIIKGKTKLEGIIIRPFPRRWFMPADSPERNIWLSSDIAAISAHTGLALPDYLIQQVSAGSGQKLPIPLSPQIKLRNDHLQYAITWYSLALALLVIYFIYLRNQALSSGVIPAKAGISLD